MIPSPPSVLNQKDLKMEHSIRTGNSSLPPTFLGLQTDKDIAQKIEECHKSGRVPTLFEGSEYVYCYDKMMSFFTGMLEELKPVLDTQTNLTPMNIEKMLDAIAKPYSEKIFGESIAQTAYRTMKSGVNKTALLAKRGVSFTKEIISFINMVTQVKFVVMYVCMVIYLGREQAYNWVTSTFDSMLTYVYEKTEEISKNHAKQQAKLKLQTLAMDALSNTNVWEKVGSFFGVASQDEIVKDIIHDSPKTHAEINALISIPNTLQDPSLQYFVVSVFPNFLAAAGVKNIGIALGVGAAAVASSYAFSQLDPIGLMTSVSDAIRPIGRMENSTFMLPAPSMDPDPHKFEHLGIRSLAFGLTTPFTPML